MATLSIGKPGAANAGILAAQMLALSDPDLARRLTEHRAEMAREVETRAQRVDRGQAL